MSRLPSGCSANDCTVPLGPVPTAKVVSTAPPVVSRARLVMFVPLIDVNEPPPMGWHFSCTARSSMVKLALPALKLVPTLPLKLSLTRDGRFKPLKLEKEPPTYRPPVFNGT